MPKPSTCPRCGGPMEEGFVVDRRHRLAADQQKWVEGEPVRSFWTGLETRGRESHPVTTFRCERCGYLESYAVAG